MKSVVRNRGKLFFLGFLIFSIISINGVEITVVESRNSSMNSFSEVNPIHFVQNQLPMFGGVNAISANLKNSSLGILYGTDVNSFPPTLYTNYIQSLAELEILNRRGTIINRTELMTQNFFAVQLERIIEYDISNSTRGYVTLQSTEIKKILDLSAVSFELNITESQPDESNDYLSYSVDFIGTNLSYLIGDSVNKLESLILSFDFSVEKSMINTISVPKVTIQPQGTQLSISSSVSKKNIEAIRFSPRLKFSCNIKGWNFSTPTSKLLLKVKFLSHEKLSGLCCKISDLQLNRESFSETKLLGGLKYSTEQAGQLQSYALDQSNAKTENYTANKFSNYRIAFGNSLRDFLTFTWVQTLSIDGEDHPITFQPLSSGIVPNIFDSVSATSSHTIFLNAGFVFPQGEDIHYDPELIVEEINPILKVISPPNRILIENSSQILIISGFFVGVLIIFNLKIRK